MNILRAAVIIASTSREKSSKESLSMPSSQTRGMLAACFVVVGENIEVEREFGGQLRMERPDDAVPFLDDTWKYGGILIKTLRTYSGRLTINEGDLVKDFTIIYCQTSLTRSSLFSSHYYSNDIYFNPIDHTHMTHLSVCNVGWYAQYAETNLWLHPAS